MALLRYIIPIRTGLLESARIIAGILGNGVLAVLVAKRQDLLFVIDASSKLIPNIPWIYVAMVTPIVVLITVLPLFLSGLTWHRWAATILLMFPLYVTLAVWGRFLAVF